MPTEILIQGGHVVTVDPSLGDFVDGDVLVRGGVIAEVGPHLAASTPDAEMIDARGRLVIPGLVDTHRHVWQGAIGGFTPQVTGAGYDPAVLRGIAAAPHPRRHLRRDPVGRPPGARCRDHNDRRLGSQPAVGRARRCRPSRPARVRHTRLLSLRRTWAGQ